MFVQAKQAPVDAQPSVYLVQELTNLYLVASVVLKRSVCSEQSLRLRAHGTPRADCGRLFVSTAK